MSNSMSNYKVYSTDPYLEHKRKGSRYSGGFVTTNGRLNNSSAYNHDYYMKNKDKWGKKFSIKDSVKNLTNKWRDKAIDSISDFMVDVSVAYVNKLLNDDRFKDLNVDQIMYDKFSPVVNRMVNEAVDNATSRVQENLSEAARKATTDAINSATKSATTNTANQVTDTITDWMKKKNR